MTTKRHDPGLLYGTGAPLRWLEAATRLVGQNLALPASWQRARAAGARTPARRHPHARRS